MNEEYDGYFLWLCDLINGDMERYGELLYILHDTDFVWCLELDGSRAVDGLCLRQEYYYLSNGMEVWVKFLEKECSVLEALIALARRMEGMLSDINTGDRTRVWFWEMVRNLGLGIYTNARIERDKETALLNIQMTLSTWMNREFEPNGQGSPFPLETSGKDEREVSMIYQLYDYLFEKHPE